MKAKDFHTYRNEFDKITTDKGDSHILGTLDIKGKAFAVIRNRHSVHAVPVDLVYQSEREKPAGLEGDLEDFPSFSEKQWREQKEALSVILEDYAMRTTPEVNAQLRNLGESRHQGYEGSVQEFQRPKKGPEISEGLDYDKASGKPDKWK